MEQQLKQYRLIDADAIKENYKIISNNIEKLKKEYKIPYDITFMAVTKTVDPESVNIAVECGIRVLGDNRVQEYLDKKDKYDKRAEVHIIGHLQTNKVKYIIDSVTMIQSVDSFKLASEIDRLCKIHNKTMDILVEVNIGNEESKSGVKTDDLEKLLREISVLNNIKVRGLMAIPPVGASEDIYLKMHQLYIDIKAKKMDNINMDILSFGMSQDYKLAIKNGSNLIRIGTGLFGSRK